MALFFIVVFLPLLFSSLRIRPRREIIIPEYSTEFTQPLIRRFYAASQELLCGKESKKGSWSTTTAAPIGQDSAWGARWGNFGPRRGEESEKKEEEDRVQRSKEVCVAVWEKKHFFSLFWAGPDLLHSVAGGQVPRWPTGEDIHVRPWWQWSGAFGWQMLSSEWQTAAKWMNSEYGPRRWWKPSGDVNQVAIIVSKWYCFDFEAPKLFHHSMAAVIIFRE